MRGQHDRSEALFYSFRLEDQIPENHLLRRDRQAGALFVSVGVLHSIAMSGRYWYILGQANKGTLWPRLKALCMES